MANRFEEQNPGVKVKQSFESSSTLLAQIQQGAPADVFASAAEEEMNTAIKEGLVKGEYGADFEKDVLSNVVSRESDVRASVNRVVVGDADATFGYASDYTPDIRDRVEIVRIPPDLNIVATYPIAALEDAKSPELAKKWVELVTSEEGQGVLQKWNVEPAA